MSKVIDKNMSQSKVLENILFDAEAIEGLRKLLAERRPTKVFFLVDENTHEHCLPVLLQALGELPHTEVLEVAPGEESKSPEVLVQLWYAMSELGADRHCMMINVGGGMITDLGGFLAGTYLRGISFVNVPTSLLAMVDASAGGKNGINLDSLKNRVGLFLEPELVCIVPQFLESLPDREMLSGFAEMLKHGLIADSEYWGECSRFPIREQAPSGEMIRRSVEIKSAIVSRDFRESGLRKVLNFGHTVGHSIETAGMQTDDPLLHGEAIALGMIAELELSVKFTGLSKEEKDSAVRAIHGIYGELPRGFKSSDLLNFMRSDKKNIGGEIRFSLLREIGEAVPDVSIGEEDITKALKHL